MLTVPQVARRVGRDPETVRRWIRSGKLRARKVGTQHVVEEEDLGLVLEDAGDQALPDEWRTLPNGRAMPNFVRFLRDRRGPL